MATMSFDYSKTSSGVTIERYRGESAVVNVPYTIAGLRVTKIGSRAFAGCKEITRIDIPYCVEEVALDAFAGCTNLKEIDWNHNHIKLSGNSIKLCGSEIQVPTFFFVREDVKELAPPVASKLLKTPVDDFVYSRRASGVMIEFYRGSAEVVVVPSKIDGVPVVSIGFDAFGGHLNLKELRLPDGLLSINWRALDGCNNLQSLYMPQTLLAADETKKLIAALPEGCEILYT